MLESRRDLLFTLLAGIFVTNAVVAELIGGKLIEIGPFTMSIGIIPWPVVFVTTDLVNEYFGKRAVRRLTLLTAGLILYAFVLLFAGMAVRTAAISPVTDAQFRAVFGQSLWIIAGSITAFLASQLIDAVVFWTIRRRTGGRLIGLRATGSTVVSQLIDTFIVTGIAFWLPGTLSFADFVTTAGTGYTFKLAVAVLLTPFIYLGHHLAEHFLGRQQSEDLIEQAAAETLRTR